MSDDVKRDDGGQAFPSIEVKQDWNRDSGYGGIYSEGVDGMSLRDWFAGQALVGLFADQYKRDMSASTLAAFSYSLADAMLEARKR